MKKELQDVTTMGFRVKVGPELPPWALRKAIQSTKEYSNLLEAVETEKISRNDVEKFINFVVMNTDEGVSCPYNYGLAALAIALEKGSQEKFAKEYVEDLSDLDSIEIGSASRVAEISLEKMRNN
jgi:hypothetical protein